MSERSAVQNPLLEYAQAIGWEYVKPDEPCNGEAEMADASLARSWRPSSCASTQAW